MIRVAAAAALGAAALELAGCAGIPLIQPHSQAPVKLTSAERSAVSAMEDSAGIQFLKTSTVTAATHVRVYGTRADRITVTGPFFVKAGTCAIGSSYKVTVHSSFVVTYAPQTFHQYDQETFQIGPGVGSGTVTCK